MVPVAALPAVSTPSHIFDPTQRLTRCPTRVTLSGVNAESICLPSCPGSIPGPLGLTGAASESAGPRQSLVLSLLPACSESPPALLQVLARGLQFGHVLGVIRVLPYSSLLGSPATPAMRRAYSKLCAF